ncbi:MAG: IS21 family transposase [Labilithrix sp.]|nr:IS21 family transposase [Labilithrix sp.]
MIEAEVVRQIRLLHDAGWGTKRIATEVGVARNTVRRYLRSATASAQTRPSRRALDDDGRSQARELLLGAAGGNAVVVRQMLEERGIKAGVRTVQRAVVEERRAARVSQLATVRFETPPGDQMQIDFGEKWVLIAGQLVRVFLLVAVLSYSRRLFAKAFLNQRSDDWREGIAAAFRHFGGVPRTLLGDNAKALVLGRDRETGTVRFHPTYLAFCRDWGALARACGPYRARTKGKTESGVKYVKRNGLADRAFASFADLEQHLSAWLTTADTREHGTTHERPIDRFERAEQAALRPLPDRPLVVRHRRLKRRVANDAFVDVDTVRYSVPFRLVRAHVDVVVGDEHVEVFFGAERVAVHRRSTEPHVQVVEPSHFEGLWRRSSTSIATGGGTLEALGRSLADYQAIVEVSP